MTSRTPLSRFTLLAPLLALFGCDDPVKIANVDRQSPYSRQLVLFAAKSGEIALTIRGNPFPAPADAEMIAGAIRAPGWLPRGTRFTTRPSSATPSNIRVVLVFQPAARAIREEALCEATPALETGPAGGKVVVAAALCVDNKPAAWLRGEGQPAASPAAKSFQNLMNQVMANLLEPRDPPG